MWNEVPETLRKRSKNAVKRKIKQTLFEILASEDCCIGLPEIIQKVKLDLFSFWCSTLSLISFSVSVVSCHNCVVIYY